MSKRVIVGIGPQVKWDRLKHELREAGAQTTSDPSSYQPDAVVATLPDGADAPAFIEHVKRLSGVRYVEPDGWASTGPQIKS